jgi:dienelactone hydrolase
MRITLVLTAIVTLVVSASIASGLESSLTASSPLSADELWKKIGNFCGVSAWDPIIERCELSADGRQRKSVIFGAVGSVVATLEDWSDTNRSFTWTNVSGLAPVANYRGKISVIAVGQNSALKWTASYDAKGTSDAEAQQIIDGTLYRAICVSAPLVCIDQQSVTPAEVVGFDGLSLTSKRLILRGYLRLPASAGPFPAVVLLHGCNGSAASLDHLWGARITAWGYVTLTVDSFGPRGLKNTCRGGPPLDTSFDAYQALNFLDQQQFVDPKRVIVVGFSQGGWLSLSSVERGVVEQASKNKFRAAAAFYPPCYVVKGPMTVPTLILIGESDDWTPAEACRKLVGGQDDLGTTRQKGDGPPIQLTVYPNAHHGFDLPSLWKPINYFGHHLEFNEMAADQSSDALREFLGAMAEDRR